MKFMETYKRLDNLCKDMNGTGITGYINDMENCHEPFTRTQEWKDDYKALKHYRWVRNKIAHEPDATEANMTKAEDARWLSDFQSRITKKKDPLSLAVKSGSSAGKKTAGSRKTTGSNTSSKSRPAASGSKAGKTPEDKSGHILADKIITASVILALAIAIGFAIAENFI